MSDLLSNREKEILELIAYENTNDEIAEKLFISNHTVKTHRKNLLEKLVVKNTAGLVRRGFELGLLRVEASGNQSSESMIRPMTIQDFKTPSFLTQSSLRGLSTRLPKSFASESMVTQLTGS